MRHLSQEKTGQVSEKRTRRSTYIAHGSFMMK